MYTLVKGHIYVHQSQRHIHVSQETLTSVKRHLHVNQGYTYTYQVSSTKTHVYHETHTSVSETTCELRRTYSLVIVTVAK